MGKSKKVVGGVAGFVAAVAGAVIGASAADADARDDDDRKGKLGGPARSGTTVSAPQNPTTGHRAKAPAVVSGPALGSARPGAAASINIQSAAPSAYDRVRAGAEADFQAESQQLDEKSAANSAILNENASLIPDMQRWSNERDIVRESGMSPGFIPNFDFDAPPPDHIGSVEEGIVLMIRERLPSWMPGSVTTSKTKISFKP